MHVTIDAAKCIGSGSCEMLAPSVFEVGDDGVAHVIEPNPSPDLAADVLAAVAGCPTQAIEAEE
ncbi:MAG TPA: ferredoxin [Acidimicrobiaceae bacterium]|nr:ferredoxin [Acidimicrobiaceae bacterium]HCB37696.1 ferredoxin [Acidimicrobiaceae bacterium]